MAIRDKVLVVGQFGVETTPGTAVATPHEFTGLSIVIENVTEVEEYQPDGSTYVRKTKKSKESSVVEVEGILTVDEFGYLLTSALGAPTTSAEGDAYEHVFTPKGRADRKALTFKQGDATGAIVAAGCYCQSLSYEVNHEDGKVEVKAKFVGQPVVTGTLTAATEMVGAQVSGLEWVYLTGSVATEGSQSATTDISAFEWTADDLIGQTQFSTDLKAGTGSGKHEAKFTMADGSDATAVAGNINTASNAGRYFTVSAEVPNHEGGATAYSFKHAFCVHTTSKSPIKGLGDGNILGYDFDTIVVEDEDNFSETFTLINGVSAYTS